MKSGITVPELSILDVAPTVLYSLGLVVPNEMQGRVAEDLYQSSALERRPVQRAKIAKPGMNGHAAGHNGSAAVHMEDEDVVLERLRELGYIE